MRAAFALCAALCATSAVAEPVVQDRYGPPRRRAPEAAAPAPIAAPEKVAVYQGPMLGWSGKRVPTAPAAAPTQVAARPDPMPMARSFRAPTAPVAPPPAPVAEPSAAEPALPDPVVAAPVARAAPPPRSERPLPPPTARAPAPQSLYDAPPPAATPAAAAPRPAPAAASGAAPSRLYSLHREYGMAPDALPPLPARTSYVLIGPGDAPQDDAEAEKAAPPRPAIDARLY
jgi:hypothetical protein